MTESMGRGVFATAPIAKGDVIGQFHTIHIPAPEAAKMAGSELSRFWFEAEDGSVLIALGLIELVNHSRTPNCDRRWSQAVGGEVASLFAVKDIAAGEQLTIDYKFNGEPHDPDWA
jgi:SET domain-containing protein